MDLRALLRTLRQRHEKTLEIFSLTTPLFSILMPLYNHERYVKHAVASVLAQDFPDFELVICNDGSTDASLEAVQKFKDPRIKIINKPNGGTVSALNRCLLSTRGRYICWLSSDDVFAPHKLLTHANHHERYPDSRLSVAPFGYIQADRFIPSPQARPTSSLRLVEFLRGNYINGLSVCVERTMYEQHGLFDNRYRYAHDVERWYKFLSYQDAGYLTGDPQSFTRVGTGNTSDADALGTIDVLKIIHSRLMSEGIHGLMPSEHRELPFESEPALAFWGAIFSPRTLFFRLGAGLILPDLVARFTPRDQLMPSIESALSAFRRAERSPEADITIRLMDITLQKSKDVTRSPPLSFAEQLFLMRNKASSDEERALLSRYLREGL